MKLRNNPSLGIMGRCDIFFFFLTLQGREWVGCRREDGGGCKIRRAQLSPLYRILWEDLLAWRRMKENVYVDHEMDLALLAFAYKYTVSLLCIYHSR